jgi:tetratricopeptide (TPR) repeat protein
VVAVTEDAAIRARLRVELSDLLRARDDASGALAELRLAAAEAPRLPSVRLALLSAAGQMPVSKRARFLAKLVEEDAEAQGDPVSVWGDAAASARAESGAVDDAIVAWLALATDARVPMYRRRAAARRASSVAEDRSPAQFLAALRLHAGLTTGRTRLALLRRAIGIARGAKDRTALLGLAADWLDIGGAPASAAALVKQAWAAGAPASEVARLEAEIARRLGRRPPAPAMRSLRAALEPGQNGAAPEVRRPSRARRDAAALLEEALQAARAGQAGRARRLAERALRSGGEGRRYGGGDGASDASLAPRLGAVDAALRQAGALREALLLRRTQLEAEPEATRARALIALAADAAAAGLDRLARTWRADVSLAMPPPRPSALPRPVSPADHYLGAQRLLARMAPDAPVDPVLALLSGAVAGHVAADEALALGERLIARSAPTSTGAAESTARVDPRFVDLLRAASAAETEDVRRARIAERLADALERLQDPIGSIAVLARALETLPPEVGVTLRLRRSRLLRQLGRLRELGEALDRDVVALTGPPRLAAFTERAALLDGAGEPERALEVRLRALGDHPAELPLLSAARRRFESTGRPDQSLRLAVAAVEHVTAPAERLALLRDIAVLSEKAARNLTDAATAWLAVLEIDPDDVNAAEAAERLLVASGQSDRCADLLAWAAARAAGAAASMSGESSAAGDNPRPEDPARRAALLWRLAELRRARLGQEDEALRLYVELGRLSGQAAATPMALDPVPGRRSGKQLALHTARAAVAPTAVDRARALLDRGLYIFDHAGKTGIADAERELMRALDLDPRNVDIVIALERVTERNGRWAELGETLRGKAAEVVPSAAARLWYGAGRASERMANLEVAREAYQRAAALDPALRQPVSALARLAAARADWAEAARLLEIEIDLCVMPGDKARVSSELAGVVGEHLRQPGRALELLEAAATLFPDDAVTLERLYRFNLAAGGPRWEQAGLVLERWIAAGATIPDAADKYFAVGAAAEADGRADRALAFYSRAYGRNNSHREALERLSEICFDRDQWENAWKATEALLDRHRPVLSRGAISELLLRSALCDVHVAQRTSAVNGMAALLNGGVRFVADGGVRDVAESWGAMRLEPRLLAGLDGERRARAVKRSTDALALVEGEPGPVRAGARQLLGAIAMVDRRWTDALAFLEALGDDQSCHARERGGFLIAAGDIRQHEKHDPDGAQRLYQRARELVPRDARLDTRLEHSLDGDIEGATVVESGDSASDSASKTGKYRI